MRFGVVVDGEAEYGSLPQLLHRIETPNVIISTPVFAGMQPYEPIPQVALKAVPVIKLFAARERLDAVVVLLDRERRPDCAGLLANQIQVELKVRLQRENCTITPFATIKDWC